MITGLISKVIKIIIKPKEGLDAIRKDARFVQAFILLLFIVIVGSLQVYFLHPSVGAQVTKELEESRDFGTVGNYIVSYLIAFIFPAVSAAVLSFLIAKVFKKRATFIEFKIFFVSFCFIEGITAIVANIVQLIFSWIATSFSLYNYIEWIGLLWAAFLAIIIIQQVYLISVKKALTMFAMVTFVNVFILGAFALTLGIMSRDKGDQIRIRNAIDKKEHILITSVEDILTRDKRKISLKITVRYQVPESSKMALMTLEEVEMYLNDTIYVKTLWLIGEQEHSYIMNQQRLLAEDLLYECQKEAEERMGLRILTLDVVPEENE